MITGPIALIAIVLAVAALLGIRSLAKRMDRLEQRIGVARPEPEARSPEAESVARPSATGVSDRKQAPPTRKREPALAGLFARRRAPSEAATGSSTRLKLGWMVWLGGICVALAGVFLVKHSIEQGLLTPWARVVLATASGFAMHALAAWLVRKTGQTHPAFSSLAAAASLTLCAAALAALHLYDLVPPLAAFLFLAAVSMATMVLALQHGPVLAALGLVGCYVVPLLVRPEGDRIVEVLVYSLIVSTAILMLIRYVYRAWLWRGVLVGSLFWWLSSTGLDIADGSRGMYLALIAGALAFLPEIDWWPRLGAISGAATAPGGAWPSAMPAAPRRGKAFALPLMSGMLLLVLAHGISIATEPFTVRSAAGWIPLLVVVFVVARRGGRLAWLPWISLCVQAVAWPAHGLAVDEFRLAWEPSFDFSGMELPAYAACSAGVYVVLSCWNHHSNGPRQVWISLAVAAPLVWLAVAYALAADLAVSREWALAGVALGLLYTAAGWLLWRSRLESLATWMILGCSGSYSLAAAMIVRDAGLTLALAVQVVPLTWLAARHGTAHVTWMTKAVLAAVVVRLTFNPWLPTYAEGSHWTLWAYGGPTLACLLASPLARALPWLRRWIEAVAAHLLVLTCWAVTRDLLYAGDVFSADYGLTEASINTAVWASLGLVYYRRAQVSEQMGTVYRWAAGLLLTISLANYLAVLLPLNPVFSLEEIPATKVWNILLLAYGAPVLLAFLVSRFYSRRGARLAGKVAAVALFVFATVEIRHLWQGGLEANSPATDGEMATYSLVWLLMAVLAILAGGMRYGAGVYRAGMALLVLTVCKVFLFDMSELTGLLRAGSFMGLGLSLLGLAYLHQRFGKAGTGPAQPST